MKFIKILLRDTVLSDVSRIIRGKMQVSSWEKAGKPSKVPHLIKEETILGFAREFSLDTLVETGTFMGDMISACRNHFSNIISIELSESSYQRAKLRFRRFKHVTLLQGDSGVVLGEVIKNIGKPCLFWLDAHYSGGITSRGEIDTPISQELDIVLSHSVRDHVVLIDDAHEFTGQNGYPDLANLRSEIASVYPDHKFEVVDNIIRVYLPLN